MFNQIRLDAIEARPVTQRAATQADVLDQVEPLRSSNHIDTSHADPSVLAGDQLKLRRNLCKWLSPPDPSTNHTIARRAHHQGTATWFFQGSIYNEWKSTPSLLWVYGKRAPLSQFSYLTPPHGILCLAGAGKSILWFVAPLLRLFVLRMTDVVYYLPVLQSSKISK